MFAFEAYETARASEQTRLDQERSPVERNKLGQFATPTPLALEITRAVASLIQGQRTPQRFLEPSLGMGSFYNAACQVFGPFPEALGVEIDPRIVWSARELWSRTGLRVVQADFTQLDPCLTAEQYDLILANPPYVRHHHLERLDKQRLQALIQDRLGIQVSGLAGLYVYFLLLADAWLADGGVAAWLIPSEFLDVNYGSALRTYLTKHVTTHWIHRYRPGDLKFSDALVTSTVVIFSKRVPAASTSVTFTEGGSIAAPETEVIYPREKLQNSLKWTSMRESQVLHQTTLTLGDLFTIRRGIATGCNSYFILDRQVARHLGIPEVFLRPILPGARSLDTDIIASDPDGHPQVGRPRVLLDCRLPLDQIESPGLLAYFAEGVKTGIDQGYLTSRRRPWYLQESRAHSPFLCTYMGRERPGGNPFRMLWNQSRAIAANTYLMISPRERIQRRMDESPELVATIFGWLQSVTGSDLAARGRVYGGGLHKLEPKELASLPAFELAKLAGLT